MPSWGSLRGLMMSIQTLRSVSAGLRMPALMTLFSALAAVVSCIHQASSQPSFWLFLEEPLSKIAICAAHIPSSVVWCGLAILFILLVLVPYALEGLITFLPDHSKISSGISYGAHDAVHLDSAANPGGCFLVIDIRQCQGLTVCESFDPRMAFSENKALNGVKDHNL